MDSKTLGWAKGIGTFFLPETCWAKPIPKSAGAQPWVLLPLPPHVATVLNAQENQLITKVHQLQHVGIALKSILTNDLSTVPYIYMLSFHVSAWLSQHSRKNRTLTLPCHLLRSCADLQICNYIQYLYTSDIGRAVPTDRVTWHLQLSKSGSSNKLRSPRLCPWPCWHPWTCSGRCWGWTNPHMDSPRNPCPNPRVPRVSDLGNHSRQGRKHCPRRKTMPQQNNLRWLPLSSTAVREPITKTVAK